MLTSRQDDPIRTADHRARAAAESVRSRFGHRLFGLPFTHLGAVQHPRERTRSPWHYWWQAQYLDVLVDETLREADRGSSSAAARSALTALRLLRGIHLRNGLRWTNAYYDDMAWLALAVDRMGQVRDGGGRALAPLDRALRSAHTADLGGGLYWNTSRDFKNTPATGPAALFFARRGQPERGQELVDWLGERLRDGQTGLYLDGIRVKAGRATLVPTVYTYNQGPVLGALLELGGTANLATAADLVSAVDSQLGTEGVLLTHGAGDGGLFTGILVRYLAFAALNPLLPDSARRTAETLVTATSENLWAGRTAETAPSPRRFHRFRGVRPGGAPDLLTFPAGTGEAAAPGGAQLSTQLQAWMILEAGYRVAAGSTRAAADERG
ncbi:putative alpha-1,6-mannanase (GH76 family) [Arthrobacter sp. CAN_A212]|uniref:glycoside hydrolase family 76 protein n=1 Tax=Arthrobacter sp. CAN_A212 TaxID=2787719 RepID=UPI0018C95B61